MQVRAVAARRLPGPALQVEQLLVGQDVELRAEVGIDVVENAARTGHELVHRVERLERLRTLEVDLQVPRAQHVDAELRLAVRREPLHGRDHGALHRVMKATAVRGCVVEAMLRREAVVLVVREPRVLGHVHA